MLNSIFANTITLSAFLICLTATMALGLALGLGYIGIAAVFFLFSAVLQSC